MYFREFGIPQRIERVFSVEEGLSLVDKYNGKKNLSKIQKINQKIKAKITKAVNSGFKNHDLIKPFPPFATMLQISLYFSQNINFRDHCFHHDHC